MKQMNQKRCRCGTWESIQDFFSLNEYKSFVRYIEEQIKENLVEEIEANPDYGPGMIFGGRWFICKNCKEVWRLIKPDPPFKGLWEPVETKK